MKLKLLIVLLVLGVGHARAQENDSVARRPELHVDFMGEMQTDLRSASMMSLLHLDAVVPLSESLSIELASLSIASRSEGLLVPNLQGYSNIDADAQAFVLEKAGVDWRMNDHHELFTGIRHVDEDYFCSDVLSLFTNSSCGAFPVVSFNTDLAIYPLASLGMHYTYHCDDLNIQASLYNGTGHQNLSGRDNIFRFCPSGDGLFMVSQLEYSHARGISFVGVSAFNGHHDDVVGRTFRSAVWAYREQSIGSRLTLLGLYSHAFGDHLSCRAFYGAGAKYLLGPATLGCFVNHTRIDGVDESSLELTSLLPCSRLLSFQPALHVMSTGSTTRCVALLRMNLSL